MVYFKGFYGAVPVSLISSDPGRSMLPKQSRNELIGHDSVPPMYQEEFHCTPNASGYPLPMGKF